MFLRSQPGDFGGLREQIPVERRDAPIFL